MIGLALLAPPASAHPLGNFSISHYSGIRVGERGVELHYVLDLAEIPTFQEIQATGIVPDPAHPECRRVRGRQGGSAQGGVARRGRRAAAGLRDAGERGDLPPGGRGIAHAEDRHSLPGGAAGRRAHRHAVLSGQNHSDRAGWKEIVATPGPGIVFIESSAPQTDRSRQLAEYPADLLNSPPQDVEARITFRRERPLPTAAAPAERGLPTPPRRGRRRGWRSSRAGRRRPAIGSPS